MQEKFFAHNVYFWLKRPGNPEDRERLIEGLRLLEDDALGGGGSRGSGRVRLGNLTLAWRNRSFYSSGGSEAELASGADLAAVQTLVNDSAFGEKLS